MKKILFMPLLRISSGHHQVADSIAEHLQTSDPSITCNKLDILHYSYGPIESIVSFIYLKWIHFFPNSYHWIYQKSVYPTTTQGKRYRLYEVLFQHFVLSMIRKEQPDFIFCTHALPSYLLSYLTMCRYLSIPVINVYTDFFINDLWGLEGIHSHFVPDLYFKEWLISKGVDEKKIFITGIPIHPKITRTPKKLGKKSLPFIVCITGGSLGAGVIQSLIGQIGSTGKIHYKIICGKNKRLYKYLVKLNHPLITPLPYVTSREEMNDLYEQIDAILTKPGGVTISECLHKQVPILVYHALPGQEQINLQHLKEQELIWHIKDWKRNANLEEHILSILESKGELEWRQQKVEEYYSGLEDNSISLLLQSLITNPAHQTS